MKAEMMELSLVDWMAAVTDELKAVEMVGWKGTQ